MSVLLKPLHNIFKRSDKNFSFSNYDKIINIYMWSISFRPLCEPGVPKQGILKWILRKSLLKNKNLYLKILLGY